MKIPEEKFDVVIDMPFCRFGLRFESGQLIETEFLPENYPLKAAESAAARHAVQQIEQYLKTPDSVFEIEVDIRGTEFQKSVWKIMSQIPAGAVKTYGEVAQILCSSPRAVGNACRRNHLPLIIPCHRIVSRSGIGGFTGQAEGEMPDIKRKILRHEGVEI